MIGYDKDDYWKDAPAIADGNYNLWRLMIDKKYQNRGYGKQAVELALRFIRTYAKETFLLLTGVITVFFLKRESK